MDTIRADMRSKTFISDTDVLAALAAFAPGAEAREDIAKHACAMVEQLRHSAKPSMMELFLGEYGLSSDEGVALMCLAEALLRVPDAATMDALIEDKIAPSEWGKHLGDNHSTLVNATTWALFVTGQVLDEPGKGVAGVLRGAIKRLGEPVIRQAVARVMREMGQQGVLGRDHVHMFLSISPKLAVSNVMQHIKGRLSRRIQMEFPELRKPYWGRRFWAIGYVSTTSRNVTDEIITQYLELHSSK